MSNRRDMAGYNARRAAQTIAYLILKSGEPALDVLKVVKLVYLADRESIARFGAPIQDELHVSMPHGPVNSITYAHIQGEHDLVTCGWAEILSDRADHKVGLTAAGLTVDDLDELSEADIGVLDSVWDKFGAMGKWELVDWTHSRENVPEWEDPNGSSLPIPLERIMTALAIPNPDEHAEDLKSLRRAGRVLDRLKRA